MRLAVSGASGRLGRAIVEASRALDRGIVPIEWSRPDFDLDQPGVFAALVERDRPEVVVHAAAWTDVDGCARDPELAMRRNGEAGGILAHACLAIGADLVLVSTNEVFDGARTDGRGYRPDDPTGPINPYGVSKLAGEAAATEAYAASSGPDGPRLSIVRTAWLFGPPGADFPMKIVAAARTAQGAGSSLRVVADEVGSPPYAADLGSAIVRFVAARPAAGVFHVVNDGRASRSDWAREVLRLAGLPAEVEDVTADEWPRPSRSPRWAVLEPTPAFGPPLRDWRSALAAHLGPVAARSGGVP